MHTIGRHDILSLLRTEWVRVSRSPESKHAARRLRELAPDVVPATAGDLGALVEALEPDGGLTQLQRARVVEILLAEACDPIVRRTLLQTLLPGIVSVARRLRFGDGIADSPSAFLDDLVAESCDLLCAWAGQRRPYAGPDLLSALRCRMRRRLLLDKQRRAELTWLPDRAEPDDPYALGSVAHALAVAAGDGPRDLRALYARCVLGMTVTELADVYGLSTTAMRRRMVTTAEVFLATRS